jgi:hypothetical protein
VVRGCCYVIYDQDSDCVCHEICPEMLLGF